MHLNIRSIDKHFEELMLLITRVKSDIDVIVCTETRQLIRPETYAIEGYTLSYNKGMASNNDGVLVYVKNSSEQTAKTVKIGDVSVLRIEIANTKSSQTITAVYRSPSTNEELFIENLQIYLENDSAEEHIFIGDINIDILRRNKNTENYLNTLYSCGFLPTINLPTRIQNGSETCIDHIFIRTGKQKDSLTPMIIETEITDHFPVLIGIKGDSRKKEEVSDREIQSKISFHKLERWAKMQNWENFQEETVPETATKNLIKILREGVGYATNKCKRNQLKRKNWITKEIIAAIERRDQLAKEAKFGNDVKKKEYKVYRNTVNKMVKKGKYNYNKKQVEKNIGDPKNLWRTINEYLNRKPNKKSKIPTTIEKSDGNVINNEIDISNEFNKYFVEVGAKLAAKIPRTNNNNNNNNSERETIANSMVLVPAKEEEIRRIIGKLKPRKAPGPDGISGEVLKALVDYIAKPLTKIVNLCFEEGYCPSDFKVATVVPVHKAGAKTECNNYRPISLISALAKVFEKCVKERLMSFVNKYKLLSQSQYGFRNQMATSDALAKFTSLTYNALDAGKAAAAVFVDLAKAFDTLDHKLLLDKLRNCGIRGIVHKLFTSYLLNREQRVKIGNTVGGAVRITHGVPQGTILGPILFVMFINDIFAVESTGIPLSYADDTVILYTAADWVSLERMVETDFLHYITWFNENSLTINIDKTQIMRFGCYKDSIPTDEQLTLNLGTEQKIIKPTKEAKYLGIVVDSQLRWEEHSMYLVNKLRSLPFMFKKLNMILNREKMMEVYYALFQSIATYGIIAWGGTYENVIRSIVTIQKSVLKIILGKDRLYPTERLFREIEVLPIKTAYGCASIKQLVKEKALRFYEGNNRSAASGKVRIPKRTKEIGRKSYDYAGCVCFNSLPAIIRRKWEQKDFIKKVTKHFLQAN